MGKLSCILFLVACVAAAQALPSKLQREKNAKLSSRIIAGSPADDGQFPYQAHLFMEDNETFCGGSVISNSWVLTAAHCLWGLKTVVVGLGSTDKWNPELRITSKDFTINPNYNVSTRVNDLALIHLGSPIEFSDKIQPLRLPAKSQLSDNHEGETVTVSGWGFTSDTGDAPEELNFVKLSVISNEECADYYGDTLIIPSAICCLGFEDPKQATCFGDSGGPLVRKDEDGVTTQLGVCSFVATAGCSGGHPSGFIRVVHYLDWINTVTGIEIMP